MIDIEHELFEILATTVRNKYPKVFITGEYVKAPSSFPCVSIIEVDNQVNRSTRDSGNIENHVQVLYEVNVYSNKTSGKKSECKSIIALIDSKLGELGFTRTMLNPIPNEENATIYRMIARYRAVISKDKTIYRR
nr:MAG TPA: PORTAL PROTEIN, 15 PROTEIN, HEAD PROTEIN, VIRAL INFECTION, TAILED.2A [Herelleviridae sp.]